MRRRTVAVLLKTYDPDMSAISNLPSESSHKDSERTKASCSKTIGSGQASKGNAQARLLQVTWEMTRECEWKTPSRRGVARSQQERPCLSTAEAFHLIEQIVEMRVPLFVLTGGDPLARPDLLPIIEFASKRSVRTSLALLPTPRLDGSVMAELKQAGLMRVAFWLHGSTPALDDAYWGLSGSHRRILNVIGACHEVQLPVQINTILARRNVQDVDPMCELLTRLDVDLWNVFFFVPGNREQASEMLSAEEHEQVFAKLYAASKQVPFQIKTTEGQQYQRFVLEQRTRESRGRHGESAVRYAPKGLNDSRGSVFITQEGDVYPSRFLPLSGGNVTRQPLSQLYRESTLFLSLRDASKLKGKCGRCHLGQICGGSRARAYAVTGDLFAEEPCCAYRV